MTAEKVGVFPPQQRVEVDDQPYKRGLWASDRMRVATWHLEPGQRIVAHAHPHADDVTVILAGVGHYVTYDERGPDPEAVYTPQPCAVVRPPAVTVDDSECRMIPVSSGHVVVAAAGTFHGVVNTGSQPMTVVVTTGPTIDDSPYVVR
jgi:quercetin dioxygenase-like cupin family protein